VMNVIAQFKAGPRDALGVCRLDLYPAARLPMCLSEAINIIYSILCYFIMPQFLMFEVTSCVGSVCLRCRCSPAGHQTILICETRSSVGHDNTGVAALTNAVEADKNRASEGGPFWDPLMC
jgi:hypothetical protein